ncbi:peptidylprolyl isomerase [Neptuniibacter sp. SY11_33]|uniref:peptidylprolyl isomerase n=1 Tax=Neptuniibacter sp. SY11_33 TaxID=3398215 RepID=UPI0039F56DE9
MLKKFLAIFTLTFSLINVGFAEQANPQIVMKTNLGDIKLELYPEKAPITVKNFLDYVDSGFYEGTIFHRTIAGFMIQGGGFTQELERKEVRDPIKNESTNGLSNLQGTISMARTNFPDSATSQFFINAVNNYNLDARGRRPGYAVFGKVTDGLDLVVRISRSPTAPKGGHRNVPQQAVIIEKIERLESESKAN